MVYLGAPERAKSRLHGGDFHGNHEKIMNDAEVRRSEMVALDRWAIETLGIPGVALMETAGSQAAAWARNRFDLGPGRRVHCIAGPGNNGGDAFVVARHLRNVGADVTVTLVGGDEPSTPDAAVFCEVLRRLEVPFVDEIAAPDAHLLVDGLLGTGLRGAPRPPFAAAIEALNAAGPPILALDVPSGLDADTGVPAGACIRAAATATFAHRKVGFSRGHGPAFVGEVAVLDIGIPYAGPGRPTLEASG